MYAQVRRLRKKVYNYITQKTCLSTGILSGVYTILQIIIRIKNNKHIFILLLFYFKVLCKRIYYIESQIAYICTRQLWSILIIINILWIIKIQWWYSNYEYLNKIILYYLKKIQIKLHHCYISQTVLCKPQRPLAFHFTVTLGKR